MVFATLCGSGQHHQLHDWLQQHVLTDTCRADQHNFVRLALLQRTLPILQLVFKVRKVQAQPGRILARPHQYPTCPMEISMGPKNMPDGLVMLRPAERRMHTTAGTTRKQQSRGTTHTLSFLCSKQEYLSTAINQYNSLYFVELPGQ
jgi:hypothetical protein